MDNGKNIRTKTDVVIFIAMGVIEMNMVVANLGLYGGRTSPPLLIGAFAMMLLSIWFIWQRKGISNFSVIKMLPLIIMGVIFFVYGILFKVPSYILYAVVFIFQLPLLCISVDRDILNKILYVFSICSIFIYGVVLFCAFLFSPLSDLQYCGILGNPNLWGEYLTFALILILYMYENAEKKKSQAILLIMFGVSMAEIFFSRSRTSMLAGVVIIVIYLFYTCVSRNEFKKKVIFMIITLVICFPVTYAFLTFATPHIAKSIGLNIEFRAKSFAEQLTSTSDRYLKGITNDGSISSGRVEIWKTYIPKLSVKGHDPEPLKIKDYDSKVKMDAHNAFIQVAYQGGYPALLMFLMLLGMCMVYYLKNMLRKKMKIYDFYALATLCAAVIYMLLSSSFSPYVAFSMFGYWAFVIPGYVIDGCGYMRIADMSKSK